MSGNFDDDDPNFENIDDDKFEEEESINDFFDKIDYNFANYDYNYSNIKNFSDSDESENYDQDGIDDSSVPASDYFCWTIENFKQKPDHLESPSYHIEKLDFTMGISFDDLSQDDESEDEYDSEERKLLVGKKLGTCFINFTNIKETLNIQYIFRLLNFGPEARHLQADFSRIVMGDNPTFKNSYNIKLDREMIEDESQGWIDSDGNLKFEIRILAVPEFLPDYTGKNSKKETGYVGLKNQGATCYMNSMLQALFHLPAFRRIVYNMETSTTEDPEKCIPLCLQRLFCQLQFRDVACSTKNLTKSFGWSYAESFMQHDIQEFCRVLIDNLENKMKGTELENSIPKLFRGKTRQYIRCVNVDYESSKVEEFYDLQMQVKGCKNLNESFAKFVEKEKMDGNNQYSTDKYGKQDAEMGVEFLEFPSVLHLHLRRFEYDYETGMMIKINDRFEFPDEIDLSPYLAKDSSSENTSNKSNIFDLYGVLVHFGSYESGHYYAFLRTSTSTQWYKFDDCCVTKEIPSIAVQDNFGGPTHSNYKPKARYGYGGYGGYSYCPMKRYSGYMLVYVRRDDADQIFQPISTNEIPQHLIDYVKQVELEAKMKKEKQIEELNTLVISVITQNDLENWNLQGNLGFPNKMLSLSLRVPISTSLKDFYALLAEELKLNPDQIRIWETNLCHNPTKVIPSKETLTLQHFLTNLYWNEITVYVEMKEPEEHITFPPEKSLILFAMFYFPQKAAPIQYIGKICLDKNATVSDSILQVNKILEFPNDTPLLVFEETISGSLKKHQDQDKFALYGINTGSVLIFQVAPGHEIPDTPFQFRDPVVFNEEGQEGESESNPKGKEDSKEDDLQKDLVGFDSDSDYFLSSDSSVFSSDCETPEEAAEDTIKPKSTEEESDEQIPFISADDIYPIKIETVDQYLDKKNNTVKVDVYNYDAPLKAMFTLQFMSSMHYDKLKHLIAKAAGITYNPLNDSMLLYLTDSKKKLPKGNPRETSMTPSPKSYFKQQQFASHYNAGGVMVDDSVSKKKLKEKRSKLFFQLYNGISELQITKMTSFSVEFSSDGYNIDNKIKLLERKSLTYGELFDSLMKKLGIENNDGVPYRILQICDHMIHVDVSPELRVINSYNTRFEVIPEDQRGLKRFIVKYEKETKTDEKDKDKDLDGIPKPSFSEEIIEADKIFDNEIVLDNEKDLIINNDAIEKEISKETKVVSEFLIEFCYISYKYLNYPRGRGDPFMVKVIPGEKFSDTKERIRAKLKEPQLSRFNRSKFEIGSSNYSMVNKLKEINDDDVLSEIAQMDDRVCMISKKQEEKRKISTTLCDASVKIFN